LTLLDAWAAQKQLDEFKKAMNENRSACGERILYP
jgi:hypothetical protein